MGKFVVSARKYRPQQFQEVQGQEHVVKTLQNAIKNDKVANAFLFCGPKGSGKTTSARLLAKATNCLAITATGEPCCACDNCLQHPSLNIHELDAASHNSAEDMRYIVEQIRFHPPNGKKKVMIIDEAHMLSNAALNVLLKPLEDTPAHVIFILVTTEKHKIISTILSRCQIFEFHAIETGKIFEQLQYVAQEEGISYEERALLLISEKAMGSLRDALSTFDLIATFSGNKAISYAATLRHLHLLDTSVYHDMVDVLYRGEIGQALVLYDNVVKRGFDGLQFLNGLGEYLRNLLVAKRQETHHLLESACSSKQNCEGQAQVVSLAFIYEALSFVQTCALHYKTSPHQRLHIELMLIKTGRINESAGQNMVENKEKLEVVTQKQVKATPSPQLRKSYEIPIAEPSEEMFVAEVSPRMQYTPAKAPKRTIQIPKREKIVEMAKQLPKTVVACSSPASENLALPKTRSLEEKKVKKPYSDQEKLADLTREHPDVGLLKQSLLLET